MSEAARALVHKTERNRGKLFAERGQPMPRRPSPDLQSVRFDIPDRWGRHPGHGLTVPRIISIYRTAERGYPAMQCDLFHDIIERDAHLRSQMRIRVAAVVGKPWIVQAGGDAPEDIEAAQLLEDRLRRVPNIRAFMRHLVKADFFGWSASEILWDEVDGVVAPVWFENVAHRRIVFDDDHEPRLVTGVGDRSLPLEPGRWVYRTAEEGNPACAGLMRTAAFYSVFKQGSIRDWVLFNERFGMPNPIGTYGDGTPAEEKTALADAVDKIGTDFSATFHESCKITSLALAGSGTPDQVQGAFVGLMNAEQSKLFLGGTLTSGEGSSTGSYALGTVHARNQFMFTTEDEQEIGDVSEQQIGRYFCEWNGFDAKPPRLKVHVVMEFDPVQRMDIFQRALAMGLELDADQIRQENQIKKPTGETLGKPAPMPFPPPEPEPEEEPEEPAVDENALARQHEEAEERRARLAMEERVAQAAVAASRAEEQLALAKTASTLANDLKLELDEKQIRARFGLERPAIGSTALQGTKPEAARLLAQLTQTRKA